MCALDICNSDVTAGRALLCKASVWTTSEFQDSLSHTESAAPQQFWQEGKIKQYFFMGLIE